MRALNRSPHTIATYAESAEMLCPFCRARGLPLDPLEVSRADLQDHITAELERNSESSARTRFIALQAFYTWLADEGEIECSPMARMKTPKVGGQPAGVLEDEHVAALLKVCSGRDFLSRRDAAIIRLMLDSGTRRSEVTGMLLDNVDLAGQMILITGKGGNRE
jgi:integrase/recombinase XerC